MEAGLIRSRARTFKYRVSPCPYYNRRSTARWFFHYLRSDMTGRTKKEGAWAITVNSDRRWVHSNSHSGHRGLY